MAYYQGLLQRVRELPEWQAIMSRGALKPSSLEGRDFSDWLDHAENFHKVLMREARLIAK